MVNLHNLHKIKIPTIPVRLLAVMLIGVLFTSVAFAGGVRDYGQDPNRQCRVPSWGSASTPDTTDWSNPPSGFGPASTLDSDDTIPNCKRMERISYTSDPTGSGVQVSGARWRYSCAECNSGYHTYSLSMPSTMVVDCVVTWEECIKDTPCDGLVCEGMSSWGSYSGTSSTHNQTRCNSSTNKCEYSTVERQAPIIKRAVTAVQISANIDVLMGTMTKAVLLSWAALKDARYVRRMQLVLM